MGTPQSHELSVIKYEIVEQKIMTQEQFDICSNYAHKLFTFGQNIASQKGLLLVDTKYEFGIDDNNNILLIIYHNQPHSKIFHFVQKYM